MCICDPMIGVTCAMHAEQSRAAAQGRPMVDEFAARAAGWVPLADVLDALRDEDAYHRWRKALTGVRPEYPSLTTRHHLADYLAERFRKTAPEGEPTMPAALAAGHPLDDVDGTFDYIDDLLRRRAAAPEGADERNGHG
jgi:hypothetical protein